MATTIFPQNDPNPADETDFRKRFAASCVSHVVRQSEDHDAGFGREVSTSGLDLTLGSGLAVVGGVVIEWDSNVTITLPDNDTCIVYIELSESSGLVQSPSSDEDIVSISRSTVNVWSDFDLRMPLALCTTSSGSITTVYDMRWFDAGRVGVLRFDTADDDFLVSDDTLATVVSVPVYSDTVSHFTLELPVIQAASGIQFDLEFVGIGTVSSVDLFDSWQFCDSSDNIITYGSQSSFTTITRGSGDPDVEWIRGNALWRGPNDVMGVINVRIANDTGGTSPIKVQRHAFGMQHLAQPFYTY